MLIDGYLQEMVKQNASDIYLTVGIAPSVRVEDKITPLDRPALEEKDLNDLVNDLLSEDQLEEFESTLELNVALALPSGERFRVNVYRQKHHNGMVIRLIKSEIPTFEELNLPEIYKDFVLAKRGLVLMVGATGSGKSTSLAAMLDFRNNQGSGHIITVEDPIEYVHEHKNCIFTQREIGIDTYSYGIALKSALRQSPDVIVIGEIRDRETLENALLFCETGHLVLATLHANNADQAIERIINLFPEEQHEQTLLTLSQNLRAIISQRLVKAIKGKRRLAYEVLINEGLVKVLIEEGKIKELKETMEKSNDTGMLTFDQCLLKLLHEDVISEETAFREADNPNNLRLKIKQEGNALEASTQFEEIAVEQSDQNF